MDRPRSPPGPACPRTRRDPASGRGAEPAPPRGHRRGTPAGSGGRDTRRPAGRAMARQKTRSHGRRPDSLATISGASIATTTSRSGALKRPIHASISASSAHGGGVEHPPGLGRAEPGAAARAPRQVDADDAHLSREQMEHEAVEQLGIEVRRLLRQHLAAAHDRLQLVRRRRRDEKRRLVASFARPRARPRPGRPCSPRWSARRAWRRRCRAVAAAVPRAASETARLRHAADGLGRPRNVGDRVRPQRERHGLGARPRHRDTPRWA